MQSNLTTIVAAVGLDEGSTDVLRLAGTLSGAAGATLHAVHVGAPRGSDSVSLADETRRGPADEILARLRSEVAAALGPAAPEVRLAVRSGTAQDEISGYAREVGADLVVLGPHRGGGISAHVLGSTAERLVKAAGRPVLIASGPLALPVQQLGVATDFSEASERAVGAARDWASALGAEVLRVVHVGQSLNRDTAYEEEVVQPGMERIRRDAHGIRVETDFVWAQEEAEGVAQWATANGISLLVVGTHGRSGLERAVLGSTAVTVARKAPCPVLLVPRGAERN